MNAGFVPKRQLHPIADADLVVNDAEVVANNLLANSQHLRDLSILQPTRDQFNNALLTRTWLSIVPANANPSLQNTHTGGPNRFGGRQETRGGNLQLESEREDRQHKN